MLPKKVYMSLSAKEKAAVKKAIAGGSHAKGKGAYQVGAVKNFVRGKGAYQVGKKNFVRGKGDLIGDILGAGTGFLADASKAALQRAGSFLGGRGDYTVGPMATLAPPQVPRFGSSERSNIINYREYLGDVYSSVEFANTVFNLNPGLGFPGNPIEDDAGCFPWAQNLANNYEKFELLATMFEFISTSSDAVVSGSTTSSLGQVVLASEYNVDREDFTNLTDALNSQFATSNKPSTNFCHVVECARKDQSQQLHYVRNGPVPEGSDLLQYDHSKLNLITQGMPADGEVIGQLWISYKIRLVAPILQEDDQIHSCHYKLDSGVNGSTAIFGTTPPEPDEAQPGSTMGVSFNNSTKTIAFGATAGFQAPPVGNYQLHFLHYGAETKISSGISVSAQTDIESVNMLKNSTSSTRTIVTGEGAIEYTSIVYYFRITGSNPTITFGTFTAIGTATGGDLLIQPFNVNLLTSIPKQLKGNFWRPRKGSPMAPWASTRKRAEIKEHKEDREERHALLDAMITLLKEKTVTQRQLEHKETKEAAEAVSEDDEESLLRAIMAKRAEKARKAERAEKEERRAAEEFELVKPTPPQTPQKKSIK